MEDDDAFGEASFFEEKHDDMLKEISFNTLTQNVDTKNEESENSSGSF